MDKSLILSYTFTVHFSSMLHYIFWTFSYINFETDIPTRPVFLGLSSIIHVVGGIPRSASFRLHEVGRGVWGSRRGDFWLRRWSELRVRHSARYEWQSAFRRAVVQKVEAGLLLTSAPFFVLPDFCAFLDFQFSRWDTRWGSPAFWSFCGWLCPSGFFTYTFAYGSWSLFTSVPDLEQAIVWDCWDNVLHMFMSVISTFTKQILTPNTRNDGNISF